MTTTLTTNMTTDYFAYLNNIYLNDYKPNYKSHCVKHHGNDYNDTLQVAVGLVAMLVVIYKWLQAQLQAQL